MTRQTSMPVLKPIKKKKRLYEDVVQQIVDMIQRGILRQGDRLPTERELVTQLGVSRTSVREALRALDLMGITDSRVKEGTFIKSTSLDLTLLTLARTGGFDGRRLCETYEVRTQLEALGVRLAARNRSGKHLRALRDAVEDMRKEIAAGERGQRADRLFHRIVAEAAGNGVLTGILAMCAEIVDASIAAANAHANVNILVDEHLELLEAIESRDEIRAEALMRDHISRAGERSRFITENSADPGGM